MTVLSPQVAIQTKVRLIAEKNFIIKIRINGNLVSFEINFFFDDCEML